MNNTAKHYSKLRFTGIAMGYPYNFEKYNPTGSSQWRPSGFNDILYRSDFCTVFGWNDDEKHWDVLCDKTRFGQDYFGDCATLEDLVNSLRLNKPSRILQNKANMAMARHIADKMATDYFNTIEEEPEEDNSSDFTSIGGYDKDIEDLLNAM